MTTIKPQSLRFYRSVLLCFYAWLDSQGETLLSLTHLLMTDWFQQQKRKGLKASTRMSQLFRLRTYLRWCDEQNLLEKDPDDLIRPSDMPTVPCYLPRPLPPDIDKQLRIRLSQSQSIYHQGLLLMRHTGIRIGELMDLPCQCVHTDFQDRRFLKVPLGKLNNERLVPLDDSTFKLITDLQHTGLRDRRLLLERPSGKPTRYYHYQHALEKVCKGLDIQDQMSTHRLRHTFATALLNGGMSLVGVMHLLGHRYIRTTMRYAAITQATVFTEYFKAMAEIEKQYMTRSMHSSAEAVQADPVKLLSDVARWLHKTCSDEYQQSSRFSSLIKRITYLQTQIHSLKPTRE